MEQPYMMPVYTVNTIPDDALATLGARASADMVLTPKAGIRRVNLSCGIKT